jgi:hypothetical protein
MYYLELKWSSINCRVFDYIFKRRIKKSINDNNFREVYCSIINYENISGRTRHTEDIKNYAIYNIINYDFSNSGIFEKI